MKPIDVYTVVYETVTREAAKSGCDVVDGHRRFAQSLPCPAAVSEHDAAVISAMVSSSPSNDWGLEGFFQITLEDGQTLGQFVRENLPAYTQYVPSMERVAKRYSGR